MAVFIATEHIIITFAWSMVIMPLNPITWSVYVPPYFRPGDSDHEPICSTSVFCYFFVPDTTLELIFLFTTRVILRGL